MTKEELIQFEREIADAFNRAEIRAPVHLSGGNEQALIDIFRDVREQDWIAVSWRSHFHCLLKGVPPAELKAEIMRGRSITLNFPSHRIVSSAIVGGVLPIALGIAWSIKRASRSERVWCFLGDMTATTGIFHECFRYAGGHDLRISFVIEDNGLSVCTETAKTWGESSHLSPQRNTRIYDYVLPFPHSGAGKRIDF